MALVQRIWTLRAYRNTKAAIDRKEDVKGEAMAEVWNDVMRVRVKDGDL